LWSPPPTQQTLLLQPARVLTAALAHTERQLKTYARHVTQVSYEACGLQCYAWVPAAAADDIVVLMLSGYVLMLSGYVSMLVVRLCMNVCNHVGCQVVVVLMLSV
jgi:hypothetical protein